MSRGLPRIPTDRWGSHVVATDHALTVTSTPGDVAVDSTSTATPSPT